MSHKAVRIEYEFPPTRAILSAWFEEEPEYTDDEWLAAFLEKHPRARIRKITRNINRLTGETNKEARDMADKEGGVT